MNISSRTDIGSRHLRRAGQTSRPGADRSVDAGVPRLPSWALQRCIQRRRVERAATIRATQGAADSRLVSTNVLLNARGRALHPLLTVRARRPADPLRPGPVRGDLGARGVAFNVGGCPLPAHRILSSRHARVRSARTCVSRQGLRQNVYRAVTTRLLLVHRVGRHRELIAYFEDQIFTRNSQRECVR